MTEAFWTAVINQVPVTVTAIGVTYGIIVSRRNGKKADEIHDLTTVAAKKADQAVINTNGHLSDLRDELKKTRDELAGAHQTITTLSTILSAQRVAPLASPETNAGTTSAAPLALRKDDEAPTLKPK